MNNILIPISSSQLDAFKSHYQSFSKAMLHIAPSFRLKGRKLADCFAQACGYPNHSEACVMAKGIECRGELRLFIPDVAPTLAQAISNKTPWHFESVLAAMIEVSHDLYGESVWKHSEIADHGAKVLECLYGDKTMETATNILESASFINAAKRYREVVGSLTKATIAPNVINAAKQHAKIAESFKNYNFSPSVINAAKVHKQLTDNLKILSIPSNLVDSANQLSKLPKLPEPLRKNIETMSRLHEQLKLPNISEPMKQYISSVKQLQERLNLKQ